jgi:hypothetical protein
VLNSGHVSITFHIQFHSVSRISMKISLLVDKQAMRLITVFQIINSTVLELQSDCLNARIQLISGY